jgi:hypothetical protein
MPIPDKIRVLRDQIFTIDGMTRPMAQGDPRALRQKDAARIRVINNTNAADLDDRTRNFLIAQGMNVSERGAATGASDRTIVVVYSPKLYALRYLISPLGVIANSSPIVFQPEPSQTVDLEIRLGNDWVGRLPAGY